MPEVNGTRFPYTRAGIAAADAARADLRLKQQLQSPYSYEDLLRGIESFPVGLVGNPREPSVRATIPLKDQLALSLEGNPYRGMGILRGRW